MILLEVSEKNYKAVAIQLFIPICLLLYAIKDNFFGFISGKNLSLILSVGFFIAMFTVRVLEIRKSNHFKKKDNKLNKKVKKNKRKNGGREGR